MIDNFKQISEFIKFDDDDDFYFLQIIKRKKENPELEANARVIRTYCIRSKEHLLDKMVEIISLCDTNNARAYINLNRRSFKKIALQTLKKVTDQIISEDYQAVRNAFESVCGLHASGKDKYWIIDVDSKDYIDALIEISNIIYDINNNCSPEGEKDVMVIPTKNGYHLITTPFNVSQWSDNGIYDLHKNNPTVLYVS